MEAELLFGTQQTHLHDRTPNRLMGYCYQCKYMGHTIKHCPLSYCTHCQTFGHLYSVCPNRKHQELISRFRMSAMRPLSPVPTEFIQRYGVSIPVDPEGSRAHSPRNSSKPLPGKGKGGPVDGAGHQVAELRAPSRGAEDATSRASPTRRVQPLHGPRIGADRAGTQPSH